ncbi:MAG: chemotaxis protein CheX [Acidobacteriaceae bacterium]
MSAGPLVAERGQMWTLHLAASVREVFEMMLGTSVEFEEQAETEFEVTALVGLAGALSGNFLLRCRRLGLERMGECMLGSAVGLEESVDALGEVCNMLAGSWKRRIPELAERCMLSVPTVVLGSSYEVRSPDALELLEQQFVFCGEPVSLRLQVQKS